MDNRKVGSMIAAMRAENEMSRKAFADRVGVPEKMVERWELGRGYPEISLLPLISEVLGVTAGELLSGERNTEGHLPPADEDALVADMIEYADKVTRYKVSSVAFSLLSMLLLFAALICLIVSLALHHSLLWSLYPIGALAVSWLSLAPWFVMRRHRLHVSVAAFLLSFTGYLFLIESIGPLKGWVIPAALPVTYAVLVPVWIFAAVFLHAKSRRAAIAALACLFFGTFVNFAVHAALANYLKTALPVSSLMITALAFVALSMVFTAVGEMQRRKAAAADDCAG